jgi:FkbM family methyltransferase
MIRRIVERLSRGAMFRRRLPRDFGGGLPIHVSPEFGGLKYWRFSLEGIDPRLLGAVRDLVRPGATVWDIGANVGLFGFAAAALGAVVCMVEPDDDVLQLLAHTRDEWCTLSPEAAARVTIIGAAVGDYNGLAELAIAERARASNALVGFGNTQMGGQRAVRTVPITTLDTLLETLPAPDVLKIDVEDAELLVLRGARCVLSLHRPALFVEIGQDPGNETAVNALLSQYGYRTVSNVGGDLTALPV